jgi:hypothetical protein
LYVNLSSKNADPVIGMGCEEFKKFKEDHGDMKEL